MILLPECCWPFTDFESDIPGRRGEDWNGHAGVIEGIGELKELWNY